MHMAGAELTVKLMAMTPDAVDVVYSACRQCYSPAFAGDEFRPHRSAETLSMKVDAGEDACATKESLIRKVVASGHESPLEHVSLTFAIRGISRSCSHQLVRHRLASYSQQSQRYVDMEAFAYVIPPTIAGDAELREMFEATMQDIRQKYHRIVEALNKKGIKGEDATQDARFILPEAAETKIVVTMNCRELLHFFSVRCCSRAQWEIRRLANEMLRICKEELPSIFGKEAGAKCERLGYCPEGKRYTCGKYPLKE
jgi:thymidylate synthase (FAD)